MVNPGPALRRRWPWISAAAALVVFTSFHFIVFGAAVRSYQRALAKAEDVGLVLGPARPALMLPARVYALVTANAMAEGLTEERGNSGALASDLLADISEIAGKHGMDVVLTEPGVITQKPSSVEIHAHFRLACTYAQLIAFLDELARSGRLFAVERFSLVLRDRGRADLELWISRLVLKQAASHK